MTETTQHFGTYAVTFTVGVPGVTWHAGEPMLGAGQMITGAYDIVTPLEIELD